MSLRRGGWQDKLWNVRSRAAKGPKPEPIPEHGNRHPDTDRGDYRQSGKRRPDAREREAIRRAEREGWIRKEAAERMTDRDALARRTATLPGSGTDDATRVPEVMAAYYRRQAERYLLRPPPQRVWGEATTPTTLEEWEPGEPLRELTGDHGSSMTTDLAREARLPT